MPAIEAQSIIGFPAVAPALDRVPGADRELRQGRWRMVVELPAGQP